MRPLFHSKGYLESLERNSSSLPPLRAERKKGGVALLGTLGAVLASLSARPEFTCLFIVPSSPEEAALLPLGSYYVHPPGGGYIILLFSPSDVRRPMSGVTHGFRSFKGKVLELLSPNLVCRLIGSVACLGLLLAVVPLLLTE